MPATNEVNSRAWPAPTILSIDPILNNPLQIS